MPALAKLYKMPNGDKGSARQCAEYVGISEVQFRNRLKKYGKNSPRLWDSPDQRWKGSGRQYRQIEIADEPEQEEEVSPPSHVERDTSLIRAEKLFDDYLEGRWPYKVI